MEKGYLKISSLCKYSDLSRRTVEKYLKTGRVPLVKLDGVILVKREDWDSFLEQHKVYSDVEAIAAEMLK